MSKTKEQKKKDKKIILREESDPAELVLPEKKNEKKILIQKVTAPGMSAINMRDVLNLADFQADPYLVLSLYLKVDTRTEEVQAMRSRGHSLLHQAHMELERRWHELTHAVREAARHDLELCSEFFETFVPSGPCRGLAIISCHGRDRWHYFLLPRTVPDRYGWDPNPLILPAIRLLDDYPRTGVILVDRETGRFFASRLGEVQELRQVCDDVPGKVREGGLFGQQERNIERHIEDHVHRHVKHVAEEAREVFQSWPVAWLLVGGNPEVFDDLRNCLVYTLRDRWTRNLDLEANASLERVHTVVLAVEDELEKERERELLQQLYDAWRSGGNGIVGLPETLRGVYFNEVDTLLVDADLHRPGYRCTNCGFLLEAAGSCPICQSRDLRDCADLTDAAIEDTLARDGHAEVMEKNEEFRRDGGIGALLRFRPQNGNAAP